MKLIFNILMLSMHFNLATPIASQANDIENSGLIHQKREIHKVLLLGNSLVYHSEKQSIGWKGNWGMAASAQNKDFAHLLLADIKVQQPDVEMTLGNIANTFERKFWQLDTADFINYKHTDPDLIILKIGENVNDNFAKTKSLELHVQRLVNFLQRSSNVHICIVGSFWPNKSTNAILEALCLKNKWDYVSLDGIYENREVNSAIHNFDNADVGKHPSDKGMNIISNRIWSKLKYLF